MPNPAEALANELHRESRATRRLLERIPADKLDWQPHPKSMTLGQLAMHLAGIPGNISRLASGDGFDVSTAKFAPPSPTSTDEVLALLDTSLADAQAFLSGLDEPSLNAPWRLSLGERELFVQPRAEVVRNLMLNHWYHHRGQLTVYLRFLDVAVPATYGNSADENPFAAAA